MHVPFPFKEIEFSSQIKFSIAFSADAGLSENEHYVYKCLADYNETQIQGEGLEIANTGTGSNEFKVFNLNFL